MRRTLPAAAAVALTITLAGCGSDGEGDDGPSMDDLSAACLDLFSSQGADTAASQCADAIDLIESDPTSEQALEIFKILSEHAESIAED